MNLQQNSAQNSLHIQTINALLMIHVNGPPLALWPVNWYVTSLLQKGRHAATDKKTGKFTVAFIPMNLL